MTLAQIEMVESVIFLPGQPEPIPTNGLAPVKQTGRTLRGMMSDGDYNQAVKALAATSTHYLHRMSLEPDTPVTAIRKFAIEAGLTLTQKTNLTPLVACLRKAVPVRAMLEGEVIRGQAFFLTRDTDRASTALESPKLASLRPQKDWWIRDTIDIIPLDIRNRWAANELTSADEGKLVEMMQRERSQTAFDIVYGHTYPRIIAYLKGKLHGNQQQTAKLIADEVFARVVGRIDTYQPRGYPFTAWVYQIARNALIDHLREPAAVSLDRRDPEDSVLCIAEDWINHSLDRTLLITAMQRIPPAQKEVIYRRFILDQSIEKIATSMGRRKDAVKQLQVRALVSMRKVLAAPN